MELSHFMHSPNPLPREPTVIFVSVHGDDENDGTLQSPLRHINTAARFAQPGDTVRVMAGIYRERIDPPRGGRSEVERITFEAAPGAEVGVRGSELVTGPWKVEDTNVWCAEIPNTVFVEANPFSEKIHGDWFLNMGRAHHTAAVYVNGEPMHEACDRDDLQAGFWYADVGAAVTRLWIHPWDEDPNYCEVEINARRAVFYPTQTGINFITVRGFKMCHAATNWAPPTAEQVGLIGTNWSKGWIIEDCTVSHSRCVGITLGKYGDEHDNTSANSAGGYIETIQRATTRGWNRQTIGSHMVRRNVVSHCGQAGIVGSLGAIFSEISDNVLHDIHVHRFFDGVEQAAIKFHAPIDCLISGNHIFRSVRAIWVDWMSQGTRITRNLCHDNYRYDLYTEVNHGPFVVDHNLFLSPVSLLSWAEGGAYVHNLFGGRVKRFAEMGRETPWHREHSTEIAGVCSIRGGDDRFYNNLFVYASAIKAAEGKLDGVYGASVEGHESFPNFFDGNVLLRWVPEIERRADGLYLNLEGVSEQLPPVREICGKSLGENRVTGLRYMDVDGRELDFSRDYFGARDGGSSEVIAGPFALAGFKEPLIRIAQLPSADLEFAENSPQLL